MKYKKTDFFLKNTIAFLAVNLQSAHKLITCLYLWELTFPLSILLSWKLIENNCLVYRSLVYESLFNRFQPIFAEQ